MYVVVELVIVQIVSIEQRAHTLPHATILQQLTLRLCSAILIGTRIPLHTLPYACICAAELCLHMQTRAECSRTSHGSTGSSYSIIDTSIAK
jgi:hypothetical protein